MKNRIYHLIPLLLILFVGGCEKKEDYEFDSDYFPRIFDQTNSFADSLTVITVGEKIDYSGIVFSPAGQVDVIWKIDGQEVARGEGFVFTPTAGGEFDISLEVTNKGKTAMRKTRVLVGPAEYSWDTDAKVAMSYLSEAGTVADLDWNTVTHIAYKGARVQPGGTLDVVLGETNQVANELVAKAHVAGKAVLLGVSGRMSEVDSWALYNANDFGSVIVDPATRATLVTNLIDYVTRKRMDGLDIMMTDLSLDAGHGPNLAALGPLLTELKAALPEGKLLTMTVGVGWQHWDYPSDLSMLDWVNVRAFENGFAVEPGALAAQTSTYDSMIAGVNSWLNGHGMPANKIVVGIPAFGMKHNELNEGKIVSWTSYGYIPYSEILAADATASEKEYLPNVGLGVYYNGIPLVKQKAGYIRDNNFKGAYLWAGDYDVLGDKSLMKALYDTLNE